MAEIEEAHRSAEEAHRAYQEALARAQALEEEVVELKSPDPRDHKAAGSNDRKTVGFKDDVQPNARTKRRSSLLASISHSISRTEASAFTRFMSRLRASKGPPPPPPGAPPDV